jgi:D-alanine--poly(phosphoribitol) ligase subunit 2
MQREQALQLVYDAIDVVNRQLPASRRLAKSRETIIVGPSGSLDSLGIVTFVITVEERAGEVLSTPVELFNGTALIDENSPLQTVDSLARFLETLD